jgi:hypothetical protein
VGKIARVRNCISLLLVIAMVAACAGAPVADPHPGHGPVAIGQEFTLAVGDSARIGETDLVLMFEAVTEDSRCARNVTCIWEGNARVKLVLREYSHMDARTIEVLDENLELNTSGRFEQRRKIPVGFIELRGLAPRPPIEDPKKYVATLFIGAGK